MNNPGTTRLFSLILLIIAFWPGQAKSNFDFNANCLKAYKNIFELKINMARQQLAAEKKTNPSNAVILLLEDYIDYFYLHTTESKSEFDRLKGNKNIRLDKLEDEDKKSPYYLYAQAEINIHWALLRGRYGEFFNAGLEIKRANSLLNDNAKKFPGFHLNLKGMGIINVLLGSLQDGALKTTLSVLGIRGNAANGLNMLEKLAENLPKSAYEPFYEETIFYYTFMITDVVRSEQAYPKVNRLLARVEKSLMKDYLMAYVSARTAHNDEAINILANRSSGEEYIAYPYLDYLMGQCRLNKLEYKAAETAYNTFLRTNKGDNYLRDTYLKLGYIDLLNGDRNGYTSTLQKVKAITTAYHERDKQAMNEATGPVPDTDLLKARFLFDGGYYKAALAELKDREAGSFKLSKDICEYYYRLGRIYAALDNFESALANFQQCINRGKTLKYYYAANSALQAGRVYEEQNNKSKATAFYNMAIGMKGHEQENSIETQARQGLRRLGNAE